MFSFRISSHNFWTCSSIVYVSSSPVAIWNSSFLSFSFKFSIATRLQRYLQISVICEKKYKASVGIRLSDKRKLYFNKISLPFGKATTEPSCKYCFVCCLFTFRILLCLPKHMNNIFGIRLQFIILRVCLCERKMATLVHLSHEWKSYFFLGFHNIFRISGSITSHSQVCAD